MDNNAEKRVTVLFLVMEFAPLNSTGNYRSLKFVKYFHEFGIDPVIVTFTPESASNIFPKAKLDNELLEEIPENTVIYRIPAEDRQIHYSTKLRSFLTVYFHIEDNIARIWKKNLGASIGDIIKKHQPAAILTSVPPFSSGGLAASLSKLYNLPLVIDMRDAWSQWSHAPYGTYLHYILTLRQERKNFSVAKAIVGVTPQLNHDFKKVHPGIEENKFHFIPNGFDGEPDIPENISFHPSRGKKLKIGYVGSFYYNPSSHQLIHSPWWKKKRHRKLQYVPVKENWKYRSPYFFFKILALCIRQNPDLADQVEFHFVGHIPDWLDGMAAEFGLKNLLHCYGFVSHAEALRIQESFDFFLTTSEKVEDGEHYCLPSKLFDYVRMKKPILGFVTEGIQREFISKSGLGLIFDPDKAEESAQKLYDLIRNGLELKPNSDYIMGFHRRKLTENMAAVLKSVT